MATRPVTAGAHVPAQQQTAAARPQRVPRATAAEAAGARHARDLLRQAILAGEYLPGERLIEAALCERLGASRFTVRAALQDLVGEGLVEVQRNKGAHVRKISVDEAVEISEIRMVVEGLVASRAAMLVTDEQATELDEIGLLMRRAVTAGEFRRYSDLNQRLHAYVQGIAAHRKAEAIIETLRGQMMRHQFALSLLPGRPAVSLPQHLRVIEAICARDRDEAEAAMRDHIKSVIEALRGLQEVGLT